MLDGWVSVDGVGDCDMVVHAGICAHGTAVKVVVAVVASLWQGGGGGQFWNKLE